ncbi:MAG TPA: endolytic transglycosylase MltG [Burkholderiales bacterium]|nr:endolytic transglycosylase MltG [Burkholderiales bacterium]
MAKRKNLFLPEPRWTVLRSLRSMVILAFLIALCAAGWLAYFAFHAIPVPQGARVFNVEHGRSLRAVSEQFAQAGLVSDRWSFLAFARVMRAAEDIKAGSYEVGAEVAPKDLLDKIVRGDFALSQVQFIEGWTFAQLRATLNANPSLKHDSLGLTSEQILAKLGIDKPSPEGLFFPDTYYFAIASSDLALLKQANARMQSKLDSAWEQRAPGLPFRTPYEALTFASIVEKETGRHDERELVASVFVNRLKRGMRLQTDPTVIYGLGDSYDGNLHRRDLLTDTAYNTYTRYGLPPTPIAMPGEASIRAAMNPAQSTSLYFVARGDGSHQFSSTLVEHNRAVNKYQLHR